MNITIDPDVFRASSFNQSCLLALQKIASEFNIYRFFVDKEGVIIREYRQIFNEKINGQMPNENDVIVRLLQQLLSDGVDQMTSKNELVNCFWEIGCTEPVEPTLLGMMANAKSFGLVLLLVGEDMGGLRKRGVHDDKIRRKISKKVYWLDYIFGISAEIVFNQADRKTIDDSVQEKSAHFETKAALYLQDNDPLLRCLTPPTKENLGEEIDVYGYRDEADNSRTVIIGECKLRRSGNESKLILEKEVKQLRRKVIAAREYEYKKCKTSYQGMILRFEGILITNAIGLEEDAVSIIKSETEFCIRVLKVTLSRRWDMQQNWRITHSEWLNV